MKEVSIGMPQERQGLASHLRLLADSLDSSNDIPVAWLSIWQTANAVCEYIDNLPTRVILESDTKPQTSSEAL